MKKTDCCIGCKKKLKRGEFVTLNGGAMVRTKTGAVMGGKDHIGFLSVHNHFDSKKNYQTFIIADQEPNGQFEFYACSHKCLADYMHKSIMQLAKFDKIKKFEMAPQTKLNNIGYEWAVIVLEEMGFKGAMVTDESIVLDLIDNPLATCCDSEWEKQLTKFSKRLGFKVTETDHIWKIAKRLKSHR